MIMSRNELADLLESMSRGVRSGDSAEGSIEYLLPAFGIDGVSVQASIRHGNLDGNGSIVLIDSPEQGQDSP